MSALMCGKPTFFQGLCFTTTQKVLFFEVELVLSVAKLEAGFQWDGTDLRRRNNLKTTRMNHFFVVAYDAALSHFTRCFTFFI